MLEPSVDQLQEKIYSKYTLITIAARRAREIKEEGKTLVEHPTSENYVSMALQEIFEDKLFVKEAE
ncbi:MAG TPA: DNA-directed RNA polymerase subunit omega [Pseudogracilibacillus sp.]|nr:DNA-directed RNA polymerase subunit omega [Pseudogracilibacillus sp.]